MNKETIDLFSSISKAEKEKCRICGEVAVAIQQKRGQLGLSQKEMAIKMGVSQAMISKWENGEYNFSIGSLAEVCEKLEMEIAHPICKTRVTSNEYERLPNAWSVKNTTNYQLHFNVFANEGA